MVTSGNDRRKLCHKDSVTIRDGDVIELIPGKYLFQYRTLCGDDSKKRSNAEEKAEESSRKRFKVLYTFFNVYVVWCDFGFDDCGKCEWLDFVDFEG